MLTPRQAELLAYIDAEIGRNGVCPAYTDMMERLGIASKSTVHRLITALEARGFIRRRIPHKVRGIEVIRRPKASPSALAVVSEMTGHLAPELAKLRQDFTVPGGGLDPDMGDDLRDWIETGEALVERARSALGAAP